MMMMPAGAGAIEVKELRGPRQQMATAARATGDAPPSLTRGKALKIHVRGPPVNPLRHPSRARARRRDADPTCTTCWIRLGGAAAAEADAVGFHFSDSGSGRRLSSGGRGDR